MANNALPSPATIEGINRAQRGGGKERGRTSGGGWRQKERGKIKKEALMYRCRALSGDITAPLVAIREETALVY